MTDDSNINAAIVYHQLPTESDLADLQRLGIARRHALSRACRWSRVTGTREQIAAISHLPAVRSIYGNRTLNLDQRT